MSRNDLVTKSYLEKRLCEDRKLHRRNTKYLKQAVYQHKYYMQHRGKDVIATNAKLKASVNRLLKKMKLLIKVRGLSKAAHGEKHGCFVKLSSNHFARLKALLKRSHLHCIRKPKGYRMPYLTYWDYCKLKRFLKNSQKGGNNG